MKVIEQKTNKVQRMENRRSFLPVKKGKRNEIGVIVNVRRGLKSIVE